MGTKPAPELPSKNIKIQDSASSVLSPSQRSQEIPKSQLHSSYAQNRVKLLGHKPDAANSKLNHQSHIEEGQQNIFNQPKNVRLKQRDQTHLFNEFISLF